MTSKWKKVQGLYDIANDVLMPIRKHVSDVNTNIIPFASKLGLKRVVLQLVEVYVLSENASNALINKGDKIEKKNILPLHMTDLASMKEDVKLLIGGEERRQILLTREKAKYIITNSIESVAKAIKLIDKVNNVGSQIELLAKNDLKRVMWSCLKINKILENVQKSLKSKATINIAPNKATEMEGYPALPIKVIGKFKVMKLGKVKGRNFLLSKGFKQCSNPSYFEKDKVYAHYNPHVKGWLIEP